MKGKYIYNHAVHRGTLISRDIAPSREFDTEIDAILAFQKDKKWYQSQGCYIWYATITTPKGDKILLEQDPYY